MPASSPPPTSASSRQPAPPAAALEKLVDRARRLVVGASGASGASGTSAASGARILLGITGSPGAGKTTLARAVVAGVNSDRPAEPVAVHLPMDGFHLANATLDRLGLRQRKGAIETFDGWGFVALLERVLRETDHPVYAPEFERHTDEPVAGAIAITPATRIVVVEGNYLLSDLEPWRRARELFAETWFCDTDESERMLRLMRRHTASGRSPDAARAWATDVDGANALRIEPTRARADLVVSGDTWQLIGERE